MKWEELSTHLSDKKRRSRSPSRVQVVDMVRPRLSYKIDLARAKKIALNSPRTIIRRVERRDLKIFKVKSSLDT